MRGRLFTEGFLQQGVRETSIYQEAAARARMDFIPAVRHLFQKFPEDSNLNEDVTEDEIIFPVLEALGWLHRLTRQRAARRRTDVPDCLLFADDIAKRKA